MTSNPWLLVKNGRQVKFRPPFEGMAQMLEYWAKKQPEQTAIEFVDVDLEIAHDTASFNNFWKCSYKELKELVFWAAGMLRRKGLKIGDTISFGYHNHPNILILSLAAWVSGMRTAPLDLKRDDEEMMRYKLELSGAMVVFKEGEEWDKSYKDYKNDNNKMPFMDSNQESPDRTVRRLLNTEALVLFTSGTTAKPKGALLTQENLMANADGIADWLHINSTDRFMILLPLHHINSTTMSLATLLRGGTIVLISRYSNSQFFEIAAKTGATLSSVVPTIIHDQLTQLDHFNILKWKIKLSRIQLGSAPVVVKEAEEFVKMTGISLIQGYGQTETALRSTGVKWSWKNLRSNTIGSEMKWTNVTVLTKEGKEELEGKEGEICVRGPVIMKKYLKNPAATKEAFKYGWFHSGDLGYWKKVGGEKQFFLKGRIREIIIKAGVNVSPMAVEEKILESVAGVDQVYAVGIADERVGEEVGAVLVLDDRSSSMISKMPSSAHLTVKGLSDFEIPKYWFSIPVERLPMTSTGKVQRVKLKEMFSGCQAIAETGTHLFRRIAAVEDEVMEAARRMYNDRWRPLSSNKESWRKEAEQKIFIGGFNKETGELDGWIRMKLERKIVLADAVTARGNKKYNEESPCRGKEIHLNRKDVEIYLSKNLDPIIEFHRKPKAGWKRGAKIMKIVKNARPGDTPAMGYGVLMEYPEFAKNPAPKVSAEASLGVQLVEAGLVYAYKMGYKRVRVLSRPVGLLKWIKERYLEDRR